MHGPAILCFGFAVMGAVALIAILVIVGMYNHLVQMRQQVLTAWAQIDVLLKRRYDLIPNLVETVKGYAAHEKETLTGVIAARNQAATAAGTGNAQQVSQAEGALSGALRQLFAVAEAYPDLKANTSFLQLQQQLAETENGIAGQRERYNALVGAFNAMVQSFPNNLLAGPFGFTQQQFFTVQDPVQKEAPAVKF